MFEDSTFESTGRIKTRSRRWMLATLIFNGTILVTLILLPLIYPDALPQHSMISLLVAPEVPKPEPPPEPVRVRAAAIHDSDMMDRQLIAPRRIPPIIKYVDPGERTFRNDLSLNIGSGMPSGDSSGPFTSHPVTVVHPPTQASVRLPSKFVEGFILYKSIPQYPAIAKTIGVQGTVVLQATISKTGTIENLRVISGPALLQQAALDAVKDWRYKPYLLNGQAVEVETSVNVIFKLDR